VGARHLQVKPVRPVEARHLQVKPGRLAEAHNNCLRDKWVVPFTMQFNENRGNRHKLEVAHRPWEMTFGQYRKTSLSKFNKLKLKVRPLEVHHNPNHKIHSQCK